MDSKLSPVTLVGCDTTNGEVVSNGGGSPSDLGGGSDDFEVGGASLLMLVTNKP